MNMDPGSIAETLQGDESLCAETLHLALGKCVLRLRSNSRALIERLAGYFSHVATGPAEADIEVLAIERDVPRLDLEFVDWKREPGKTGRKDAYVDVPGGRVVLKVRTGMVFLQSGTLRIAAGPCLRYDNQVINFINAQYMNWLQHRGWLICHAAGLVHHGRALGMAGFSGGGKSTLMLHLMDDDGVAYLTNDRLFVRPAADGVQARGIPKLPRVNPGTLVHNRRLRGLLSPAKCEELLALPPAQLWELEDKYDVYVDEVYGPDRIRSEAPLSAFLVLNWRRDSTEPARVGRVDLSVRRDLLGAIMKSPGPFYQYPDGSFFTDTTPLDESAYLEALAGVEIHEATGGVDFPAMTRLCLDELMA